MRAILFALVVGLGGCAEAARAPPVTVNYAVHVHEETVGETNTSARVPADDVLVLQSTHLDRPAEVVGVVDVHAEMGHQDAALDALRRRARSMGADAVVGVEFHHSDGAGEPTHLSGLAVRFVAERP
jgi:uncharacterized protein YbjQ (UPF0145 family)